MLQTVHLGAGDPQRLVAKILAAIGHAQIGAQIEQIVLDARQHGVDEGVLRARVLAHQADRGIRLVDGTVGFDTQVVLAHTFAIAQTGRALVAGARVDLVQFHHGRTVCCWPVTLTSSATPSSMDCEPDQTRGRCVVMSGRGRALRASALECQQGVHTVA